MKSKVYKIIQIVLLAIMGLIILILGIYVIKKVSSGNKPVKMFGFSIYEVDISGSMYNPDDPESLLPGDLLFVKAQKEYFVGDVITYQLDEAKSSVTHKIINIDGSTITTQGINPNNSPDEPFDEKYIVGKVVTAWRGFGEFKESLLSPYTIIAIVLIGVVIAEGLGALEKRALRNEEEKKALEEKLKEENKTDDLIVNQE